MELSQDKAPREFDGIKSIEKYFERNPAKLVQYVQAAIRADTRVPGIHLSQLSQFVHAPLKFEGEEVFVPPYLFVPPKYFTNIHTIMSLARADLLIG